MRFRFAGNTQERERISGIVGSHCSSFRLSGLRSVSEQEDELLFDLDLRHDNSGTALVSELKEAGVRAVSLLPAARVQGG